MRESWGIFSPEYFKNCEFIFPTQQKDIYNLLQMWKNNNNIKEVVIFGSSTTSACNPWSDIDVYVKVEKAVDKFEKPKCVVPFDIWTNYDVDDRLLEEIERTGILVYER